LTFKLESYEVNQDFFLETAEARGSRHSKIIAADGLHATIDQKPAK